MKKYLVSPLWDYTFLINNCWLLPLGLILFILNGEDSFDFYFPSIVLFLSLGHLIAPIFTILSVPNLLKDFIKKRRLLIYIFLAYTIPILLLFFSFKHHPSTGLRAILFLGVVTLIWDTWHFSSQHFGILSIYRHIQNRRSPQTRNFDRLFTGLMICLLLPASWYLNSYDIGLLEKYLPPPQSYPWLKPTLILTSSFLFCYVSYKEFLEVKLMTTRMIYLLFIYLQVLVSIFSPLPFIFLIYIAGHWITEIALISHLNSNRTKINNRWSFILIFTLFIVVSVLFQTFSGVPQIVLKTIDLEVSILDVKSYMAHPFVLSLIVGGYLGTFYFHYLADRVLFKFSNEEVKQYISPLVFRQQQ